MKVKIDNCSIEDVLARDMKIGQVAVAIGEKYKNEVLLCHSEGFVSLSNPELCWHKECTLKVMILPHGTKIELELD